MWCGALTPEFTPIGRYAALLFARLDMLHSLTGRGLSVSGYQAFLSRVSLIDGVINDKMHTGRCTKTPF